jgi:hypothetical protein
MTRDHPRVIQGPPKLSRGYCANFDAQCLLTPSDATSPLYPPIEGDETMQNWMDDWDNRVFPNSSEQEIKESLLSKNKVHKLRNYFSDDDYIAVLINYVCSYATKGEISSSEGAEMFLSILRSHKVSSSTEFKKLAQKFNMAVLGCKSVASAEAVFLLQGMQLYRSSVSFQVCNLKSCFREIRVDDYSEDEDETAPAVGTTKLDKFFDTQKQLKQTNPIICSEKSLYDFCTSSNKYVTNFKGDPDLSYPFQDEDMCKLQLLKYKKGVTCMEDLKLEGQTYVQSFTENFLNVPAKDLHYGHVRQLQRAYVENRLHINKRQRLNNNRGVDEGEPIDTPRDTPPDDDDEEQDLYDLDEVQLDELSEYPSGDTRTDRDLRTYPTSDSLQQVHYDNVEVAQTTFHVPKLNGSTFIDPSMVKNNLGQRKLIIFFLSYLRLFYEWFTSPNRNTLPRPECLRAIVCGVAGTGKSFVIKLMRVFSMFALSTNMTKYNIGMYAPTAAAATAVDGETFDRGLKVPRGSKEHSPLDENEALSYREKLKHLIGYFGDELSMIGKKFLGNIASRCTELLLNGVNYGTTHFNDQGEIPCSIFFGDYKQLPPVRDVPLFSTTKRSRTVMGTLGEAVYKTYTTIFLLDTPVRQNPDSDFIRHLQALRDGKVADNLDQEVDYWNSLKLSTKVANAPQQWDFMNDEVLYCTCYNKDKDALNNSYLQRFKNVCIVQATCQGNIAPLKTHPLMGQMAQIPRRAAYGIGMLCKMTANIAPKFNLVNGARGILRDIVYEDFCYDPNNHKKLPLYLVVEFPNYNGPSLFTGPDQQKWVPVLPIEKRSEDTRSSRKGFPIVVSKADTVHSLQGLTVGLLKAIKRLVIHKWDSKAESKWPGILYVAASRAESDNDLALDFDVTNDGLSKIVTTNSWKQQHNEVNRLSEEAMRQRDKINSDGDDEQTLKDLTIWLCGVTRQRLEQQSDKGIITNFHRAEIEQCLTQWESNAQMLN